MTMYDTFLAFSLDFFFQKKEDEKEILVQIRGQWEDLTVFLTM
jgi:hypothetical protein